MALGSSTSTARSGSLIPAPWALLGFALLGVAAVLDLPSLGRNLGIGDSAEPSAAPAALTGAAILLFTAGYLMVAAVAEGLPRKWVGLTFGYCSGIAVIKFGVSPASFENAPGTGLVDYLKIGVIVMLLYCAGLWAIQAGASRNRHPRQWSLQSKLTLLAGLVVFALVSRYLAALALGTGADDYLTEVFGGTGWLLFVLLAVVSAVAIESFDIAGRGENATRRLRSALLVGLAVVVTYHGLWALFMVRQFD